MKNVDVDIYISQLKGFFEKNPNSLIELIGNLDKNEFFIKVEEQCYKNFENGDEVSLTKNQMINIVVELNNSAKISINKNINSVFELTPLGLFSLN